MPQLKQVIVSLVAILVVLALSGIAAVGAGRADDDRVRLLVGSGTPTMEGADGAFRYDDDLVPEDAALALLSVSGAGSTRTVLRVSGLLAARTYGAHLHVNSCATDPATAGPHYQQVPDPQQPSVDPAYVNPTNEVWLDLHTNGDGGAVSFASNPWMYHDLPGSLVLHAEATRTAPGEAGMAGPRIACLSLRTFTVTSPPPPAGVDHEVIGRGERSLAR